MVVGGGLLCVAGLVGEVRGGGAGPKLLSGALPREADEIERAMAKRR